MHVPQSVSPSCMNFLKDEGFTFLTRTAVQSHHAPTPPSAVLWLRSSMLKTCHVRYAIGTRSWIPQLAERQCSTTQLLPCCLLQPGV